MAPKSTYNCKVSKITHLGDWGQQLRAHAILIGNPVLLPTTHMAVYSCP